MGMQQERDGICRLGKVARTVPGKLRGGALAGLFCLACSSIAQVTLAAGAATANLKIDTAIYDVNAGVLQFAFTFTNPGDSVLYLDCQLPPRAVMEGNVLSLTFSRAAGAGEGAQAGGPVAGDSAGAAAAVNPDDFPPQRVAGGQAYQGQRRLDRLLGDWQARPKFASLRIKVDYYPEKTEGEGMFVVDRAQRAVAPVHAVMRRGKPPAPPKVIRLRTPRAP